MIRFIAIIDIGSNSIRLMIASVTDGRVKSISKSITTTRLAKGIDETHYLAEDRIADSVRAIIDFQKQAAMIGAPVLAYATSAVRDAKNRDAFVDRVKRDTGLQVRVLSGEEEGKFAFDAVAGGEGTVFDIGGGSFQIVTKNRALSVPCGCVRAKEQCSESDPKALEDKLFPWMDAYGDVHAGVPKPVYGVGGTISTIGALLANQKFYDPHSLEPITIPKLYRLTEELASVPLFIRMQMPLLYRRSDIILQGATILKYMMLRTNTDCVIPSDRDGMEGIAEEAVRQNWI